eukprot:Gregarina_sp_Pseudo_9__1538@NODE_2031_length_1193_cov_5_050260_g1876_i0_p1_GENE_NODE_2031_length_1193_cov_5_050260_g1876_i0NODE_2031_length_1193_cov_5_050260_g1876_i0_p1_ORF_typecomplete_len217_score37_71zfCHY/PF05495_12/7_9e14zfRING_2/PF13639_6/8_2e03zfRING_2/PF13639_6/7_1e03zfRING_2/PF13639_6/2_3e10zfC3HC4/PF00097_25/7_3e02zfC3HC4/PF00097_25/1_1e09zfC3HC4_2/PF13923_6/74zfC3HC4_2/PF13923_6/2_2e09zfRING_UBOX/PF13445_6/2_3e03zfRING_UBOX/PF13445_6/3e07zfRING_5/PF14634_6/6_2e03zfRING_5/PF14634_6/4_
MPIAKWLKSKFEKQPTQAFACSHYKNSVQLYFSCCSQWYPCLRCHRAALPEQPENQPLPERRACLSYVDESRRPDLMQCLFCNEEQTVAGQCLKCAQAPKYFCATCYIWDNTDREIYHCGSCGICRVGNKSKVFHCDGCGTCLDKVMENKHQCLKDGMLADCPICLESLSDATLPACQLPRCGHSFHQKCLKEFYQYNPNMKCPMCKRALVDSESG